MATRNPHLVAARIVADAGGNLVGRTRLQKIGYLMQLAGFGDNFSFEYRHFGPYSQDLASGMDIAAAFKLVNEEEKSAAWGGRYSVFTLMSPLESTDPRRSEFVHRAKEVDAVELELAATAAFLFVVENQPNPWTETARRKPDKASDGRLQQAKNAYEALRLVRTPRQLPALPNA